MTGEQAEIPAPRPSYVDALKLLDYENDVERTPEENDQLLLDRTVLALDYLGSEDPKDVSGAQGWLELVDGTFPKYRTRAKEIRKQISE